MTSSIRRSLTIAVIGLTVPMIALCAYLLYRKVADTVWSAFDRDSVASASVLADIAEHDEEGYEFDLGPGAARVAAGESPLHFQLWHPDGSTLARAASLGDQDLPRFLGSAPKLGNITLADDTRVRVVGYSFVPRTDKPEPEEEESAPPPPDPLTLSVARETAATDAMLRNLAFWFWGIGAAIVLFFSWLARQAITWGLRPVARIANDIERLDPSALDTRIPTADCPEELRPLVGKLNDLLGRLEKAFARERRFTADAAHELRTPLTVLRTEAEVALRRNRDADAYRAILERVLATVIETGDLVETLLALARADAGQIDLSVESVHLHDLVAESWQPQVEDAASRELSFTNEVEESAVVETDREKLRLVVANLLSNAVRYSSHGGRIRVSARPEQGLVFEVENTADPIPDADLSRLFERFWRADEARSDAGLRCGLGLALVRSLCDYLGYEVVARNRDGGWVSFSVTDRKAEQR